MKVSRIKGNRYIKYLFTGKFLGEKQISIIFWKVGGISPAHDHSVAEKTFVILGNVSEITKRGRTTYATKRYPEGSVFDVVAGAIHVVRADESSITLNICYGNLKMNIIEDFKVPSRPL